MQALTPTLFPCYAPEDREIVRRIAAFLERGADLRIFLEEGEMKPGEDLASKAREARMADIVLVLFSRDSLPPRWPRTQWEDALVKEPLAEDVRIAFVRCDDCVPPKVLDRMMFDASLKGQREVKRWIRTGRFERHVSAHEPELEVLGIAIADRAGVESIEDAPAALEFARVFRDDFDAVCILECAARSTVALAGDLGAQLGLILDGPLESNLEHLRSFCSARRILTVFTGCSAAAEPLIFEGGRCSTLICASSAAAPLDDPIHEAQRVLAACTAEWSEICRQARQGRRHLHDRKRLAECHELMVQWHRAAEACGDREVLDESAREMVWILEEWGFTGMARDLEELRKADYAEQMLLPFSV